MEHYIAARKNVNTTDFLLEEFLPDGTLPFPQSGVEELMADRSDSAELLNDFEAFINKHDLVHPLAGASAPASRPKVAEAA